MRKTKKQKSSPKLNWRLRDKLIHAIFKGQSLFVKNTGVKVSVEHFGDNDDWTTNSYRKDSCKIVFETVPTSKALRLVNNYSIHKNCHSNTVETNANISLHNLSLSPFETPSAKLLYDKVK
mgnify:CR=1 FL=1